MASVALLASSVLSRQSPLIDAFESATNLTFEEKRELVRNDQHFSAIYS